MQCTCTIPAVWDPAIGLTNGAVGGTSLCRKPRILCRQRSDQCLPSAGGRPACDMAANNSQGLFCRFANQLFQSFVFSTPCFYLRDHVYGNIDGFCSALMFVSQVPSWLGTAFSLERTQRAFDEGVYFFNLPQGGLTEFFVPGDIFRCFHANKVTYLLILSIKKRCRKIILPPVMG